MRILAILLTASAALLVPHIPQETGQGSVQARIDLPRMPLAPSQGAIQPKQLQIPSSAFLPYRESGTGNVTKNSDSSFTDRRLFPRSIHSRRYTGWGRVTGYAQTSGETDGDGTYEADYEASVFTRVSGASAAWKDAGVIVPDLVSRGSLDTLNTIACQGDVHASCIAFHGVARVSADGSVIETDGYAFILVNTCLAEINVSYNGNSSASPHSKVDSNLGHIESAAYQRLKAACTTGPTARPGSGRLNFTFDSLSIQRGPKETSPGYHEGHRIYIVSTFTVYNLRSAYVTGTIQRVYQLGSASSRTVDSFTAVNGKNPPLEHTFELLGTGELRVTVTIRIGTIQRQRSVTARIVP
jgi:hypothetical protein